MSGVDVDFSMWIWPYRRWGGFDGVGRAAKRIEQLGFANITVSDHVFSPVGTDDEGLGADWPDWAVTAAFLASVTRRLRIVACVAVPYRPPLVLAKQIASVDQLSKGRLTLAACVGWCKPEFDTLGVPYGQRGAIADEYLEAMRRLWTSPTPRFDGDFTSFSKLTFEPRCHQYPHVPIWIAGGAGRKPLERLVRIGDGWMPMGNEPPAVLAETIASIRRRVAAAGRDPSGLRFRYTIGIGEAEAALDSLSGAIAGATGSGTSTSASVSGGADQVADAIGRYAEAGFNELAINPAGASYDECMDRIEWFAEAVLPQFVGATQRPQAALGE